MDGAPSVCVCVCVCVRFLISLQSAREASYPGRVCIVVLLALGTWFCNIGLLWATFSQVFVYLCRETWQLELFAMASLPGLTRWSRSYLPWTPTGFASPCSMLVCCWCSLRASSSTPSDGCVVKCWVEEAFLGLSAFWHVFVVFAYTAFTGLPPDPRKKQFI